MIEGVDIIYIIPPIVLAIVALLVGLRRLSEHGPMGALTSSLRVIVYGGCILFVLFLLWVGMYYAGGGH